MMIKKFLKIRLIQIKREMENLGILYSLVSFILIAAVGFMFYNQIKNYPNYLYATALAIFVVLNIHVNRKDKRFISINCEYSRLIYLSEYLFFSIPLFIIIITSSRWYSLLILLSSYMAISFIDYESKKKVGIINFSKVIPYHNFEWRSGLRKYFWYILLIYTLAVGLLFIKFVSLFLFWILVGCFALFYQECEPLNILQINEMPAQRFIQWKIKGHLLLFVILSLPIMAGYILFNPDHIWITSLVYSASLLNFILFILLKYSSYEPNAILPGSAMIGISIAYCSIIMPFLLPIPLIMCVRGLKKSLSNLDYYLNAYN